jgi:hypothetical protein
MKPDGSVLFTKKGDGAEDKEQRQRNHLAGHRALQGLAVTADALVEAGIELIECFVQPRLLHVPLLLLGQDEAQSAGVSVRATKPDRMMLEAMVMENCR